MRSALRNLLVAALAGSPPAAGPAGAWPPPPFEAELDVDSAYVRLLPDATSAPVGVLRRGDRPTVTGCAPACAPDGWALLHGGGAVRLGHLRLPVGAPRGSGPFLHGKVLGDGAPVRSAPDAAAPALRREAAGHVLAFVPDDALRLAGWLERTAGGFVRADTVRLETPSRFAGERDPIAPLALFRRETRLLDAAGRPTGKRVPRHGRLPALGIDAAGRVQVEGGSVARGAVRLAFERPRPPDLSAQARWVHVDLAEQVLTAYEGDTLVYATLVSTGARGRETRPGLYAMYSKIRDTDMCSERWHYHIEEVPFALFFDRDRALHGTFWHDRFGTALTHGCVNLSMADAEWLFQWAPPPLPPGWHGAMPAPGAATLWVMVERAPPGELPGPALAAEPLGGEAP